MKQLPDVSITAQQMLFSWKTDKDQAVLERDGRIVWQGSLLPSFELADGNGLTSYTDAIASNVSALSDSRYEIALEFGEFGRGSLQVIAEAWGIRFANLEAAWHQPVSIVALYFGTKRMTDMQRRAAPSLAQLGADQVVSNGTDQVDREPVESYSVEAGLRLWLAWAGRKRAASSRIPGRTAMHGTAQDHYGSG